MEQYLPVLEKCTLFRSLTPRQIAEVLNLLHAGVKHYGKSQILLHQGEVMPQIGIVVQSEAYILQEDFWGDSAILAKIQPSQIFGEVYACTKTAAEVTVQAAQEAVVIWVDVPLLSAAGENAAYLQTAENLLMAMAEKTKLLAKKTELLSRRTTRKKLLAYFSDCARAAGSDSFTIPFRRQQLADYLCVERSAMSAELGRMQREGLLETKGQRVVLKTGTREQE